MTYLCAKNKNMDMSEFKPTEYKLSSVKSGKMFEDAGWSLEAPGETEPTLIRAEYEKKQIDVKDASYGLFRFADWLPIKREIKGSSSPVTYKSEGLAAKLGLENLWITFNGYWPERGGNMRTCSFKETEAYTIISRLSDECKDVLVVASAGNTARAFARVCSDNKVPLVLCVPEDNINALWFNEPIDPCVKLLVTKSGSDYTDAINLSNIVCSIDGFFAEGGAKNVARRDGMSTTMLSATTTIGRIPDSYYQGVGSGTGAIAAWEANMRLIADGRFGSNKMRLVVSQNAPFLPMYDAWKADSRALLPFDEEDMRIKASEIDAKVLSNRKPPYSIYGGLYDALKDSKGDVKAVTNEEAREAARIFEETEGIDIYSAAAVATASLMEAVAKGEVRKDEVVMLNITGGGEKRYKRDFKTFCLQPNHVFDINATKEEVKAVLDSLF